MYAFYLDGKIHNITRHPNKTSRTPIDETSQEWLDYVAKRDRVPTGNEELDRKIAGDPAFRELVNQLESQVPGFKARGR